MSEKPSVTPYEGPAGGWGSVQSLGNILVREGIPVSGPLVLQEQNKPKGFQCVSCAWIKPAEPHLFEYCENGAKATAWEITTKRVGPDFFAKHTCKELEGWADHDLEAIGRITEPLRWDAETDKYVPISWEDAFREIGEQLRGMDPKRVVFYASGRASLEATYWKPRTCTRCGRACSAPTTCRTAATCATSRPRSRCPSASARPRER